MRSKLFSPSHPVSTTPPIGGVSTQRPMFANTQRVAADNDLSAASAGSKNGDVPQTTWRKK